MIDVARLQPFLFGRSAGSLTLRENIVPLPIVKIHRDRRDSVTVILQERGGQATPPIRNYLPPGQEPALDDPLVGPPAPKTGDKKP